MAKTSIKTALISKYEGFTLLELEAKIEELQQRQKVAPSTPLSQELAAARFALQQRQRQLKARVIEFEQNNSHHLLFFCSTRGFVKLAGHSALFFAMTVADRLHWRYSLKLDTDHYSVSEDGIISFRSLETIAARLAEINIFPDHNYNDPEMFYFELPKVYNSAQIDKLRDNAKQDIKRIMSIVLPASPIPSLYDAIMQASHLIYYQFKHLSDTLARDTIGHTMIDKTYEMAQEYLRYAHAKAQSDQRNLLRIVELSRELRFGIAYASKLQILHHREVCKILEYLISVERIAGKAYLRSVQDPTGAARAKAKSRDNSQSSDQNPDLHNLPNRDVPDSNHPNRPQPKSRR